MTTQISTAYTPPMQAGQQTVAGQTTRLAAASRSQHLQMELVTKEGDKVTLSLDSRNQAFALDYAEAGYEPGLAWYRQGQFAATREQRSMNLTVEGDLSAEERKQIDSVIKTLKKMVGNFVNDRIKPMMAQARKLTDLETIAGLELDMSYSRTVLVARQTELTSTYDSRGNLDGPEPASEHRPAPPAETAGEPRDPWAEAAARADDLTDAVARRLQAVTAFVDDLRSAVQDLFEDVQGQVAAWNPEEPKGPELIRTMFDQVSQKAFAGHPLSNQPVGS